MIWKTTTVKSLSRASLLLCLCVCVFWAPSDAQTNQTVLADKVVVLKSKRQLSLMKDGKILKTYKVALGGHPVGPKTRQGDQKTPEGNYVIDYRSSNSKFHLFLHISYPNTEDIRNARKRGVSPGGNIGIHGLPNGFGWIGKGHLLSDWTDGCIAVTDEEIEEIWRAVPDGTPIEIKPS